MLKRIVCLFLSFAMVFTMLPFQVFAEEDITEATEMVHETEPVTFAAETQPVETEAEIPETTEAAVPETQPMTETQPEETVPAQTVPEETIPVETETEPAAMESEPVEQETEPVETEPEQTIPEETVFYQENVRIPESVSADAMMASTAADSSCGEELTWSLDENGVLTISGKGDMYDYEGGNAPWFDYQDSITQIVIETGITRIGNYAFNFTSRESSVDLEVEIPEGVTTIGENSFSGESIVKITLSGTVTTIEDGAFGFWCGEDGINIPDGVTSIGKGAFESCRFTSVSIPEGVTALNEAVFQNCGKLVDVTIPDTVTFMGANTFYGCSSLKSVEIPEKVDYIGECAFFYCDVLESVTFCGDAPVIAPEVVGAIFDRNMTAYYPAGNETWNSETLQPYNYETTTWIAYTREGDTEEDAQWTLEDGVLTISGTSGIDYRGWDKESVEKVVILDGITEIRDLAFSECPGITSITIPDSVTKIGNLAFKDCYSLTEIVLPKNISSIGDGAFLNCGKLEKITFEGSAPVFLTNNVGVYRIFGGVGKTKACSIIYCANDLTWTESVRQNYGGSVTWESYLVFPEDCGSNLTWNLDASGTLTISGNGAMDDFEMYNSDIPLVPWGEYLQANINTVIIDEGVTHIGNNAFRDWFSIKKVTLPSGLKSIGNDSFRSCGVTEITIPDGVTSIGEGAFLHTGIRTLEIPKSVTDLGASVFSSMPNLVQITLPNELTSIPAFAFCGDEALSEIVIPASVKTIGDQAFATNRYLQKIRFLGDAPAFAEDVFLYANNVECYYPADNVTWTEAVMQQYGGTVQWYSDDQYTESSNPCGDDLIWTFDPDNARLTISGSGAMYDFGYGTAPWYRYNPQIEQVVIDEEVTNIGHFAFSDCTSLKEIVLPESIAIIGDSAFSGCSNMEKITFEGSAPMFITNAEGTYSNFSGLGEDTFCCVLFCANDPTWTDEVRQEYGGNITWGYFINYPTECGTGLTWEYDEETSTLTISGNGAMDDFEQYQADIIVPWYDVAADVKTVIVGEGVTNIGDYAFYQFTNMTHVELPDTLTSIGENSFAFCYKLTEVTIPNTVGILAAMLSWEQA